MNAKAANLKAYRDVNLYGSLTDASPHQVILVMLDTALTRVAQARGHMERGEAQPKTEQIGKALGIVEGLVMSLDPDQGGEIATNLTRLYDYMGRTLLKANLENKVELLDEVLALLQEIKSGWEAIPEGERG